MIAATKQQAREAFVRLDAEESQIADIVAAISAERDRQNLSLENIKAGTGIDRANLSRLFSGVEHNTSPAIIVRDLKHAADQLPKSSLIDEGTMLQEAALKAQRSRRKEPQELGTLLVAVLARLGIAAKDDDALEST